MIGTVYVLEKIDGPYLLGISIALAVAYIFAAIVIKKSVPKKKPLWHPISEKPVFEKEVRLVIMGHYSNCGLPRICSIKIFEHHKTTWYSLFDGQDVKKWCYYNELLQAEVKDDRTV